MAKKSKSLLKSKQTFSGLQVMLFVLAFASVGAVAVWQSLAAPVKSWNSICSVTPSQVVLDQDWIVNVTGLPTKSTVYKRIVFPDGGVASGPISITSGGTYTETGNSNMTKDWGFIAPEQKGTYTYQFVNKVRYPGDTFTRSYAMCSVQVN
jgi:hypothetical protein